MDGWRCISFCALCVYSQFFFNVYMYSTLKSPAVPPGVPKVHFGKQCYVSPSWSPPRSGPTRLRDFGETPVLFGTRVPMGIATRGFPGGPSQSWCPGCHHWMNPTPWPRASLMGNCLLHLQPSLTLIPDFRTFQDSDNPPGPHEKSGRVLPTRYPPPQPLIQHPPCALRNHLSSTWTLMDRQSKCSAPPGTARLDAQTFPEMDP